MAKKFCGITYNEEQWNIKGSQTVGYTIENSSTLESYPIKMNDVIGIFQVTDNEFLIYQDITNYRGNDIPQFGYSLSRIRLSESDPDSEPTTETIFSESFKDHCFLTEDTILFDNKSVYSIKENRMLPEFEWLKYKVIELKYDPDSDEEYPESLLVTQFICRLTEHVECAMVLVDPKTFKPIKPAYSTLRDQEITLTDTYTFDDLISEDKNYEKIISYYLGCIYSNFVEKGKYILLSRQGE